MKVSVIVLTYGHEKYIRQCLDSILMQQTDFDFEIIVAEDASPDNTKMILQEYEKKYPCRIQMLYREINCGAKKNLHDCFLLSQGEYIAFCEGDDFWLDKNKLQTQIDFFETHPDASAVYHRVIVVDKNGKKNESLRYPSAPSFRYSLFHYDLGFLPSQLASLMMVNIYKSNIDFSFLTNKEMTPGDRILAFVFMFMGNIYCLPNQMSAYRLVIDGGGSYSARKPYLTKEWQLMNIDKWLFLSEFFKKHKASALYKHCYYQYLKSLYRMGDKKILRKMDKGMLLYFMCWSIRRTVILHVEVFLVHFFHIRKWRYVGRSC